MKGANAKAEASLRDEQLGKDAVRFAGAGLLNTAITFLLYQVLVMITQPPIAYAGTWVIGIGIVALLYPSYVFRGGDTGLRTRLLVALVYIGGFVLGLTTVTVLTISYDMRHLAILGAIFLTTLFNFVAMRFVTRRKAF